MSGRFTNFQARLEGRNDEGIGGSPQVPTPPTPAKDDEPGPEIDHTPEQEDSEMSENTPLEQREDYKAGFTAGQAEGGKAATDRMNAVFAHENAKGREAHAVRLLGRSMTADEITAELAHFPKADALSADEQREAAEEGGRKVMQDAMKGAGNAELGSDNPDSEGRSVRAKSDGVWDRANATVGRTKKEA